MLQIATINVLVVLAAVVIHFEALHLLTLALPRVRVRPHLKLIFAVCGALLAHTLEVWLFAFVYFSMHWTGHGSLIGNFDGSLIAFIFHSLPSLP